MAFGGDPEGREQAAAWGEARGVVPAAEVGHLLGVYGGGVLLSACAAVPVPGRVAFVWCRGAARHALAARAAVAGLVALQESAWQRSIKLLEALLPPGATALGTPLTEAGFVFLTRLLYLSRPVPGRPAPRPPAEDLEWVEYTPQREPLFQRALELAYQGSLDCPPLAGVRTAAEVLAGQRAAAGHDPKLWWTALRQTEPVGVLLLNELRGVRALEIVYIGAAPAARGTGVADALLRRAVEAGAQRSATNLTLAVDGANAPARRMYARWGFTQFAARDAWIATRPGAEG